MVVWFIVLLFIKLVNYILFKVLYLIEWIYIMGKLYRGIYMCVRLCVCVCKNNLNCN